MNNHTELELKFSADHLEVGRQLTEIDGCIWAENTNGPDDYYVLGRNIIRHRLRAGTGPAGELTVKRRTANDNKNRLEVDLHFDCTTSVEDVRAFLKASGWKRALTIFKEAHIWWTDRYNVVFYEAWTRPDKKDLKKFVEIEILKGTKLTPYKAERLLKSVAKKLTKEWDLGKPIKQSLYEIYGGTKYQILR